MALTRLSQRSQVGLGFKAKGDLPAAIRHFEQAISYDPGYARGYNNLGNALQASAHTPHRSIRPTWRLEGLRPLLRMALPWAAPTRSAAYSEQHTRPGLTAAALRLG